MGWKENQDAVIADQKAWEASIDNASDHVPAADDGPLAIYTRPQSLFRLAQLQNCLDAGALLPSAGVNGLTIDDPTRAPLSKDDRDDYIEEVAKLTEAGNYTDEEIAGALAQLEKNLKAGVSLDPATAANT